MMLIQFAISFGVLALLGLTYYLRRHTSKPVIPFQPFLVLVAYHIHRRVVGRASTRAF